MRAGLSGGLSRFDAGSTPLSGHEFPTAEFSIAGLGAPLLSCRTGARQRPAHGKNEDQCYAEMFFHHRSSGLPFRRTSCLGSARPAGPPGFSPTVNLTMEQKHIIKETVKELKIEGVAADIEVAIGEAVPKTVQLHPMPAQLSEKISHIKNHLFFLKGAQIVIVDPKENTAVDIID